MSITCPLCREPSADEDAYWAHLADEHGLVDDEGAERHVPVATLALDEDDEQEQFPPPTHPAVETGGDLPPPSPDVHPFAFAPPVPVASSGDGHHPVLQPVAGPAGDEEERAFLLPPWPAVVAVGFVSILVGAVTAFLLAA